MEKPNIFKLATKELSQDAFFTWLLQWADSKNSVYDQQLNETAKDFVKFLIQQQHDTSTLEIKKVDAGRQWKNIDIWAEVNDEYFIVIEDKTNSAEHSEQLQRYKEIAETEYKNYKLVFVYLKTGNESVSTLKQIVEKGYSIVDRKTVLSVLNKRQVTNEIFNDFKDYLTVIENATNSYAKFENITSEWKAGEGFFMALQDKLQDGAWGYVPNPKGGFLGFWYHWTGTDEIGEIYIQIENAFEKGIKLVIKIADWEPSTETLYELFNDIEPFAEKNGLSITKPDKYRAGATSTLAIIQNAFTVDSNGHLDLDQFVATLKKLEQTLDEYCTTKKHSR